MDNFRIIITGSRNFKDYELLSAKMDILLKNKKETHKITVVSGGSKGADKLGEKYAQLRNYGIVRYKAMWTKYGSVAGYLQHNIMACNSDAMVAFWSGTKGTEHMIKIAKLYNLELRIVNYNNM